ncbi:MAG: hypothetical protein WCO94_03510 [Verrucomicrobiota bacterium]
MRNRKEIDPAPGAEGLPLRSPLSDIRSLEAEADAIAARRADPRTPAVVRRAFLRPCAMTLFKFLQLEEAASPALTGQWPWADPAAMAHAFCTAYEIVFPEREIPAAVNVGGAIAEIEAEIAQGFSTVMPMKFPTAPGSSPTPIPADGIGWVARIWARLGGHPAQLDMPMDQIFILAAAMTANEGAECAGEDYRERKLEKPESAPDVVLGPVGPEPEEKHDSQSGRRKQDEQE